MIYFVRHGETDYNKQKLMQGQLDIPLNENGILQAQTLRDNLKDIKLDLIYCSPLKRAEETAKIINEFHSCDIVFDSRLLEMNLGDLQGQHKDNVTEEMRIDFEQNGKTKYHAETYGEFHNRCVDVYKIIKKFNKNVLIVSHGGVGFEIKSHLKMNLQNWIKNCELVNLGE